MATSTRLIDGRYQLGDVLGSGGMGEVRAARDLRLQRDVAVKLLHTALLDRAGMRERIRSEARSAARLSHPNVVAVLDAGVDDAEVPYIVMERLGGRTLADELVGGPMPVERARSMALQVLDALSASHALGLVHRDVKPGNVLAAGGDNWKVADFGIAKWLDEAGITKTGEVLGSPDYLAPERLDGSPASFSSDLYSVGVLLYEALTGRRPAAGDQAWAVAVAVRGGAVPSLAELRPEAGPALERVVARAMSPDPADRFASAEEMADALRWSAQATVPFPVSTEEAATTAVMTAVPEDEATSTAVVPTPKVEASPPPMPAPPALGRRAAQRTARGSHAARHMGIDRVARAVTIGAVALVLLIVVVLVVTGGPADPPRSAPAADLPVPLAEALDRLEESIP